MRVLNYLEGGTAHHTGGMATAAEHQRAALEHTDVEVVTSPWRGGSPLGAVRGALEGSPFAEFDLAHVNMNGPASLLVAEHARRAGIPLVVHGHTTAEDFAESFRLSTTVAPALGKYLAWYYSRADLVLCPSEYTRGILQSYPVDAPIYPITNGVDHGNVEGHEQFREEYRDRYDLDGTVVFAVGHVFERKGLTTFCRVAQATDYDFAWFGPYQEGPTASARVRHWTNDPPENVQFTGFVEDIRGAYGAGDVYLFPAKVENQGIAVLEAMACGKACVLRDIPVFREFYEDGHDCLLCETDEEFARAVRRLAENPDLRARLGENARETAAEHALPALGERLAAVYREVARQKREAA